MLRTYKTALAKVSFFWTGPLGTSIIIGGKTLSKFLIKKLNYFKSYDMGYCNREKQIACIPKESYRYEILSLSHGITMYLNNDHTSISAYFKFLLCLSHPGPSHA